MARPKMKVAYFKDFTGGLNTISARQALRQNETSDCMDVDFGVRGGFTARRGYLNVVDTANMDSGGYLVGHLSFGTELLWGVSDVGRLWTWSGSVETHVATAITDDMTARVRGVAWGSKLYLSNCRDTGNILMRTWDGSSFVSLGNTPNDNYTAPAGGNAPKARLIADHAGHLWWADTVESGTRYRSRVRYSHPLQPADFATDDYFDLGADDQTDEITALATFRGQLLVFKKRGLWAVYGTDGNTFLPEQLTSEAGAWSQECVAVSPSHVYWWSPNGNLFAYDGNTIVTVGDRILGDLVDGHIQPGDNDHWVSWANDKLWVGLGTTTGRNTYVFDPRVGSNGAWTRYSPPISSLVWWRRNTGVNGVMARIDAKPGVQDFGIPTQEQDDDGTTVTAVPAYYTTSWFSANDAALSKRWRRMHLTAFCGDSCEMQILAYTDFDESTVRRTFNVFINSVNGQMVWGDPWGTPWNGGGDVFAFERLPNAGRSHSIRFKFTISDHMTVWGVDSFALPYQEKGYR